MDESAFNPRALKKRLADGLLAAGEYRARIANVSAGRARSSGQPLVVIEFAVDGAGPLMERYSRSSPIGEALLSRLFHAVGLGDEEHVTPEQLIGREVVLTVVHGEFLGVPQARVRGVAPVNGATA